MYFAKLFHFILWGKEKGEICCLFPIPQLHNLQWATPRWLFPSTIHCGEADTVIPSIQLLGKPPQRVNFHYTVLKYMQLQLRSYHVKHWTLRSCFSQAPSKSLVSRVRMIKSLPLVEVKLRMPEGVASTEKRPSWTHSSPASAAAWHGYQQYLPLPSDSPSQTHLRF